VKRQQNERLSTCLVDAGKARISARCSWAHDVLDSDSGLREVAGDVPGNITHLSVSELTLRFHHFRLRERLTSTECFLDCIAGDQIFQF
jgi:hypothetical protein